MTLHYCSHRRLEDIRDGDSVNDEAPKRPSDPSPSTPDEVSGVPRDR